MGFRDRVAQTDSLIQVLSDRLWKMSAIAGRLLIAQYGYETYVSDLVRQEMRFLRSPTAKHIRFTPDFFIIDRQRPEQTYLLDNKVTQTPIYSQHRLDQIRTINHLPELQWQDIGQMEADAYDNYMALRSLNIRVAILNYCAYHERLLLWDYVENLQILHRDQVTGATRRGSRTPFVNFACLPLRTLSTFLEDEHQISLDPATYNLLELDLKAQLPITHHPNSPLYSG